MYKNIAILSMLYVIQFFTVLPKMEVKKIQDSILKVSLHAIRANSQWMKAVCYFHQIHSLQYSIKKEKQRKFVCCVCKQAVSNILMLLLHIELQHTGSKRNGIEIQSYEINEHILTINIQQKENYKNVKRNDFLTPLKEYGQSFYLFGYHQHRVRSVLGNILSKIYKKQTIRNQPSTKYLHSTDIFRQVGPLSDKEDSQDQIGVVQRELEEMRIKDFTDISEVDKMFFIQWNNFIHQYKKKMEIIYPQALGNLLKEFVIQLALNTQIDMRLNLTMHLWCLWSLGQINSQQTASVLERYDKIRSQTLGKNTK